MTAPSHWPHGDLSRHVTAAGVRWHVQVGGAGPAVLLIHGTGAASHSWRGLLPLLARRHTVIAPDLPGHGFSGRLPQRPTLPAMAAALAALLKALKQQPVLVVGHSAGAAIAARMALDGLVPQARLVALNGVLLPLPGLPALVFSPLARMLSLNPLVPALVAWRGRDARSVQRLIDSTGSTLDAEGIACYARLVRDPGHIAGVLAMMSSWDLRPLERDLPQLQAPLTLIAALDDRTVPPGESRRAAARVAGATVVEMPGLGHLAHEEAPGRVAKLIEPARR